MLDGWEKIQVVTQDRDLGVIIDNKHTEACGTVFVGL